MASENDHRHAEMGKDIVHPLLHRDEVGRKDAGKAVTDPEISRYVAEHLPLRTKPSQRLQFSPVDSKPG